jgi:hypothetical protein
MQKREEQDIGGTLGWRAFAAIAGVLLVLGGAVGFTLNQPPRKFIEPFETVCPQPVDDDNIEVMHDGRVAWNQWILPDQAKLEELLADVAAHKDQPAVKIWFSGAQKPKIADEIQATAKQLGVKNVELIQKQRRRGRRQST